MHPFTILENQTSSGPEFTNSKKIVIFGITKYARFGKSVEVSLIIQKTTFFRKQINEDLCETVGIMDSFKSSHLLNVKHPIVNQY